MKIDKQIAARFLRQKGYSINRIAAQIGVSKSSVSHWVRNISLTEEQRRQLKKRSAAGNRGK